MPSLFLITASGTAQRRLLEETQAELEKKGYVLSGKQEGGDWGELLSDNMSGGLFDDNRMIIIESAALLGAFPEDLGAMADPSSPVVLILIYDTDPAKHFPKKVLEKCRVIKAPPFPRWARERQAWVLKFAREAGVSISKEAAALLVELTEDPEEMRRRLLSLSLLRGEGAIMPADVENMCLDDGTRNLLKLLDGLCGGDCAVTLKSLRSISKNGEIIPLISALHNRMRLAWYASANPGREMLFSGSLGAKDYAWRMAGSAARLYPRNAIADFVLGLIRMNISEKSGTGAGWIGLETLVTDLLGKLHKTEGHGPRPSVGF